MLNFRVFPVLLAILLSLNACMAHRVSPMSKYSNFGPFLALNGSVTGVVYFETKGNTSIPNDRVDLSLSDEAVYANGSIPPGLVPVQLRQLSLLPTAHYSLKSFKEQFEYLSQLWQIRSLTQTLAPVIVTPISHEFMEASSRSFLKVQFGSTSLSQNVRHVLLPLDYYMYDVGVIYSAFWKEFGIKWSNYPIAGTNVATIPNFADQIFRWLLVTIKITDTRDAALLIPPIDFQPASGTFVYPQAELITSIPLYGYEPGPRKGSVSTFVSAYYTGTAAMREYVNAMVRLLKIS